MPAHEDNFPRNLPFGDGRGEGAESTPLSPSGWRRSTAGMGHAWRDYLAARRRAETELRIPAGTRIAFTGGMDCNDHHRIWAVLDKARAKHPDMVLLHGGSPKGAERIAACWADHHKVPQIVFKPDWTRHAKAAPFKRNDQLLEALPAGLVAFPGSGISANLADKARKLGIPVWRHSAGGGCRISGGAASKGRLDPRSPSCNR